jgi:RNA polymerase sigma factor for flagellar operon FliA
MLTAVVAESGFGHTVELMQEGDRNCRPSWPNDPIDFLPAFARAFLTNPDHYVDTPPQIPTVDDLPLYQGIDIGDVTLVDSLATATDACRALLAETVLGFDTEAKPTFAKGEVSTGPHLVQLATERRVYLFPVNASLDREGLREILESTRILKVGFGLGSDLAQLSAKLGIEARHVLDLSRALPGEKPKQTMGAKTAVARYLGRRMQKSKRITTSNWAHPRLNERQMLYAADDAQVALRIYHLALAEGHLEHMQSSATRKS